MSEQQEAANTDRLMAVAEAIAVVDGHAGFIREGRFSPGPNTLRIAKEVLAHLAAQGWTVTPENGRSTDV